MHASYSVQQIKFELLSYMKEFGTTGDDWRIAAVDARTGQALVEAEASIWITKPAVGARAAGLVCQHMIERFGVRPVHPQMSAEPASWVLMYRVEPASGAPGA